MSNDLENYLYLKTLYIQQTNRYILKLLPIIFCLI